MTTPKTTAPSLQEPAIGQIWRHVDYKNSFYVVEKVSALGATLRSCDESGKVNWPFPLVVNYAALGQEGEYLFVKAAPAKDGGQA